VKTAAETFRQNPKLDTARVITELGVGEALVSVLDERGTPTVVERAFVYPPRTQMAPLSDADRAAMVRRSKHTRPLRWPISVPASGRTRDGRPGPSSK